MRRLKTEKSATQPGVQTAGADFESQARLYNKLGRVQLFFGGNPGHPNAATVGWNEPLSNPKKIECRMDSGCPPMPATIARMNNETCKIRKQQFMQAVQILAPGDQFIYQAAQRIPGKRLPSFPGGAALEVVVAFQELREPINIPIKPKAHQSIPIKGRLSLSHAIRVKSAEYWLMLGEADAALRELEALPKGAWNHPSAHKVSVAAMRVLDERRGA